MKKEALLIITGLAFLCFSCNRHKEIWEIRFTYPDGTIETERRELGHNKRVYISYYPTGDTNKVWYIENDEFNGAYIHYNKNHSLNLRATYKNDLRVDTLFSYGTDGVLDQMQIIDSTCADTLCCCNGVHLDFKNGKLYERYRMSNMADDGLHETFFPSGRLHQQYYFKGCSYEGPYKSWYENGKLKAEGNYVADKREGTWHFFTFDGGYSIETFKNGLEDGPYFEHIRDTSARGVAIQIGQCSNDKESGHWLVLDKDSALVYECNYEEGERTGAYTSYYKNGKMHRQGKLINDKWEGPVKIYSETGTLDSVKIYHKDKEVKR